MCVFVSVGWMKIVIVFFFWFRRETKRIFNHPDPDDSQAVSGSQHTGVGSLPPETKVMQGNNVIFAASALLQLSGAAGASAAEVGAVPKATDIRMRDTSVPTFALTTFAKMASPPPKPCSNAVGRWALISIVFRRRCISFLFE